MIEFRKLLHARRAIAGIEFAILLPVLVAIVASVADLSFGLIMANRLTAAAGDVAAIASTMSVQVSNLNVLTGTQAWQATTAPFAIFPEWRNAGAESFSITLTGVDFTSTNGAYQAHTRWSVANPLGTPVLRPCGQLGIVPNGSSFSLDTLPAGATGATSVLVADVSSYYVPIFTSVFTGPVAIARSAYFSPRLSNGIRLSDAGPGKSVICPST